jgi:hypothetical protein
VEPVLPDAEPDEVFPPEVPVATQPLWPQPQPDRLSRPLPPDPPASQRTQETSLAMPATTCHSCSNPLEQGEAFCGLCGTPRPGQPSRSVQSNWASLWRMQQAAEKKPGGNATTSDSAGQAPEIPASPVSPREVARGLSPEAMEATTQTSNFEKTTSDFEPATSDFERLIEAASKPSSVIKPGMFPAPKAEHPSAAAFDRSVEIDKPRLPQPADSSFSPVSQAATPDYAESGVFPHSAPADLEISPSEIRIVPDEPAAEIEPATASPWTSAHRAHAWLEAAKGQRRSLVWLSRWWWRNRASVYVAIAAGILCVSVVMFVVSLTRANAVQSPPVATAHRRKAPPPPNLTLFEKFLVSIGLAEPPDAPVYNGNPNTKVWVDVHTALYYCPGAELYGKTQGGKMTTQHDAQQDQFEPANRKVCD